MNICYTIITIYSAPVIEYMSKTFAVVTYCLLLHIVYNYIGSLVLIAKMSCFFYSFGGRFLPFGFSSLQCDDSNFLTIFQCSFDTRSNTECDSGDEISVTCCM